MLVCITTDIDHQMLNSYPVKWKTDKKVQRCVKNDHSFPDTVSERKLFLDLDKILQ